MEVVSGIIIGFDTDTPKTGDNILEFIRLSQIPTLTINLLYALPKTPLWRRLEGENRLIFDEGRESNVDFLMPYNEVLDMWRYCITEAYKPEFLYERFKYQCEHTYPNRISVPNSPARLSRENILQGLRVMKNLFIQVGLLSDYRDTFWQFAKPMLKAGRIQSLIHVSLVSHHLIKFTQECAQELESASFYSQKLRDQTAVQL